MRSNQNHHLDPSNAENKPHRSSCSRDMDQAGMRLFRCSFCKRGFSNAQALGGHMNIHRKDRARLKEFSDSDHLHLQRSFSDNDHLDVGCSSTGKRASASPDREDGHQDEDEGGEDEKLELTLNIEASSKLPFESRVRKHAKTRSMQQSTRAEEDQLPELDLELRLGSEPPAEASTKG